MCDLIPKIETQTRLLVIMHFREVEKTTNTSQLATQILCNSEIKVRGQRQDQHPKKSLLEPGYQPLLLYPAPESVELNEEFLRTLKRPICLIVPDGTWRQARKVKTREAGMAEIPWVKLAAGKPSEYQLRRVPSEESLCTFEAIARAIGVIESQGLRRQMEEIFRIRMERILWSKGKLRPEDSLTGIPQEAIEETWRAGALGGAKAKAMAEAKAKG
jgi:DTW domain-containing protein